MKGAEEADNQHFHSEVVITGCVKGSTAFSHGILNRLTITSSEQPRGHDHRNGKKIQKQESESGKTAKYHKKKEVPKNDPKNMTHLHHIQFN